MPRTPTGLNFFANLFGALIVLLLAALFCLLTGQMGSAPDGLDLGGLRLVGLLTASLAVILVFARRTRPR